MCAADFCERSRRPIVARAKSIRMSVITPNYRGPPQRLTPSALQCQLLQALYLAPLPLIAPRAAKSAASSYSWLSSSSEPSPSSESFLFPIALLCICTFAIRDPSAVLHFPKGRIEFVVYRVWLDDAFYILNVPAGSIGAVLLPSFLPAEFVLVRIPSSAQNAAASLTISSS